MHINLPKLKGVVTLYSSLLLLFSCETYSPLTVNSLPTVTQTYDVFYTSELAEDAYLESRWTDAARYYQQLTERVPNDAYNWFKLANTYAQKGELNLAIHAYETSIKQDALQPKPWFNLSTTYLLSAKMALLQSWENLREADPARDFILDRIETLDSLLNQSTNTLSLNR